MAIYHLEVKNISRSDGRSSVASSAYRNGISLHDERQGKTFNYAEKSGVFYTECFMLDNQNNKVFLKNAELWNTAEKTEKRKDSRTAKEIIINLPHELSDQQRIKLVQDFSKQVAEKYKVGIDFAIHRTSPKGDKRNHHAHIMMTTRDIKLGNNNEIVLNKKTNFELENKALKSMGLPTTNQQVEDIRQQWQDTCNKHLALANIDVKIDCRSYEKQGKNQLPTIKLGHKVTALERAGIATNKGEYNRQVMDLNYLIENSEIKIDILKDELKYSQFSPKQATRESLKADTIDSSTTSIKANTEQTRAYKSPTPFDMDSIMRSRAIRSKIEPQPKLATKMPEPAKMPVLPVSKIKGFDFADSEIYIFDPLKSEKSVIKLNAINIKNQLAELQKHDKNLVFIVRTDNKEVVKNLETILSDSQNKDKISIAYCNKGDDINKAIDESKARIESIKNILSLDKQPITETLPQIEKTQQNAPVSRIFKP